METENSAAWLDVEVLGVFLQSFAGACVNLKILAGEEAESLARADPNVWCPGDRFRTAFAALEKRFQSFDPIKERVGVEMMRLWYEHGPGRSIVKRGVDFLRFQTGSEGYGSVVRGPAAAIGAFTLEHLDETG